MQSNIYYFLRFLLFIKILKMNLLNNVSVIIVLYKETFEIISKTLNQIRDF